MYSSKIFLITISSRSAEPNLETDPSQLAQQTIVYADEVATGELGTGKLLIATLSPGGHTITLTATDADGAQATATIQLSAGDRVFLPVVLRGR